MRCCGDLNEDIGPHLRPGGVGANSAGAVYVALLAPVFASVLMLFGYLRVTSVASRLYCGRGARLVDWVRDWWQRRLA